jgi:bisphosphoglycerate-dependent phosphoglycerate mutase
MSGKETEIITKSEIHTSNVDPEEHQNLVERVYSFLTAKPKKQNIASHEGTIEEFS